MTHLVFIPHESVLNPDDRTGHLGNKVNLLKLQLRWRRGYHMLALLGFCALNSCGLIVLSSPSTLLSRTSRLIASAGEASAGASPQQIEAELIEKLSRQRASGKTDSEIIEDPELMALANAQVAAQGGDPSALAPAAPRSGTEPWGRWSQSDKDITIEFFLEAGIKGRDVVCEVAEGWLCVRVDESYGACYDDGVWGGEEVINESTGPPLLFGRFAQARS
jgi:hypothetical protein